MKFTTIILLSILMVLGSCNSKKEVVNVKEDQKQIESNLIKEGYTKGKVVHYKSGLCTYIIIDEKTGLKFDPININNEQFKAFKVDKKGIYFKYRPLRRANRCSNVQPIELEDAQSD